MSVIVKGMDMSKSCNECIMCVDGKYGERCLLTNQYIETIIDNCLLTALPEKHGRLIDADALIDYLNTKIKITADKEISDLTKQTIVDLYEAIIELIQRQKTVIESEE